jgi:hypothetical protein
MSSIYTNLRHIAAMNCDLLTVMNVQSLWNFLHPFVMCYFSSSLTVLRALLESSVYVLALIWETKFHAHTKHRLNCSSLYFKVCRSQWPCGLRHELSSLARMLRSWVPIPLKVWMSVLCAFILWLCCSVCTYRSCDRLIPRPRSPTDCV